MDTIQNTLIKDLGDIIIRIMRMMDDLMSGNFRALKRDVRAFEARVRLWLVALAMTLPAGTPVATRPSTTRNTPPVYRPTLRQRHPRFGLRLTVGPPPTRAPKSATATTPKPRAKRDETLRLIQLAELFYRLSDLKRTLSDPSEALAKITRTRPAKPAPELTRREDYKFPVTDPETNAVGDNAINRRLPNLPRPES